MRRLERLVPIAVLVALLSLLTAAPALAAVVPLTFDEMSREAATVVVARVESSAGRKVPPAKGHVVTDLTFDVLDVLAGSPPERIALTHPGGQVGAERVVVSELPTFKPGETVLLFLDASGQILGGRQGSMSVTGDRVPKLDRPLSEIRRRVREARGHDDATPKASPRMPGRALPQPSAEREMRAAPYARVLGALGGGGEVVSAATGPVTMFESTFEGGDTTGWSGTNRGKGGPWWGPTSYRAAGGISSLYATADGTIGVTPAPGPVPLKVNSWFNHTPVDLRGFNSARLEFDLNMSTGLNGSNYFVATVATTSTAGWEYWPVNMIVQGSTNGWRHMVLNLSDVEDFFDGMSYDFTNKPVVYVSFYFSHGSGLADEGAYIDNVKLVADVVPPAQITSISPGGADAGIGQQVTITGTGFGESRGLGHVEFYGDGSTTARATVTSWSDTSITAVVPAGASSGPVRVYHDSGVPSNGYTYDVGFSYGGLKWLSPSMSYRINANTTDTAGEEAAVRAGADAWALKSYFSFNYAGPCASTANMPGVDGRNDIYWASTGFTSPYILAWNVVRYIDGGQIVESDIVFNDRWAWGDGAVGSGTYDIQTVATHELGHSFQLLDEYGMADMDEIMYGMYGDEERKRVPSAEDIRGLRYIYGHDATAPVAPTVVSSTHPSDAAWYSNPDAAVSWTATDAAGVTGYSWVLDRQPDTTPDQTSEGEVASATFTGLAEGVHWLHVRAVDLYGNWSATTHRAIRVDTLAPTGTMSLANGAAITASRTVSVDSLVGGAVDMRIDAGAGFGEWAAYTATASAVLPLPDGLRGVVVEYRDAAGNTLTLSDDIELDTTAPTGTLSVADGVVAVNRTDVTVRWSVTGASEFRVDSGTGWSTWAPFESSLDVTLSGDDGVKTVRAEFRDVAGNTLPLADEIVLDRVAPLGGPTVVDEGEWVLSRNVTLRSAMTDAVVMRLDLDGGGPGPWSAYAEAVAVTLPEGDGAKTIAIEYRDIAGNVSSRSVAVDLDTIAPSGTMVLEYGETYTTDFVVSIGSSVSDPRWGEPYQMRAIIGGRVGEWESYAAEIDVSLPEAEGVQTVAVDYRDRAGNTLRLEDDVIVDTAAPSGTMILEGGATVTGTTMVNAESAVTGAVEMNIDAGDGFGGWTAYDPVASIQLPAGDGIKPVIVEYRDEAGNVLSLSDDIVLDTTAPTGTLSIEGGAEAVNVPGVLVTWDVDGAAEYRTDAGSGWSEWRPFVASVYVVLPGEDGDKTVKAEFRDEAGNLLGLSDSIVLDRIAPVGGELTIDEGAHVRSRSLTARSRMTDAVSMRFALGGDFGPWVAYAETTTVEFQSEDGPKTIECEYRDVAGNVTSRSVAVDLDTTAPTGALAIDDGAAYTKDRDVSIGSNVADERWGTPFEMRVTIDAATGEWQPFSAAFGATLSDEQGEHVVAIEYRDRAGNVLRLEDAIVLDSIAPNGAMTLAGDVLRTKTREVAIDSSVEGATEMRVDAGEGFGEWVAYAAGRSVFLSGADGMHFVEVEYRDHAGNVLTLSDQIELDTTAPVATMQLDAGAAKTVDATVSVDSMSADAIEMSIDTGAGPGEWRAFAASVEATLPGAAGVKTVSVRYRDAVGNVSAPVVDTIEYAPVARVVVYEALGGRDRYVVSVAASRKAFKASRTVLIATGQNFPDALGGGALAGAYHAPILLVPAGDKLPSVVSSEIRRLGAKYAIVLGGERSVTPRMAAAVKTALGSGGTLKRLGGRDRYATADLIAAETKAARLAAKLPWDGEAFVVTGESFPDALVVAPIAYRNGWPVILSSGSGLTSGTRARVKSLGLTEYHTVGSTKGVVAARAWLDAQPGFTVDAVTGTTPAQRGVRVAERFAPSWDRAALATADVFADALCAGPLQGEVSSIVLLTPTRGLDARVRDALKAHKTQVSTFRFLGGEKSVPTSVRNAVKAALKR